MSKINLVCPFHKDSTNRDKCGFKTTSDVEYMTHTMTHEPRVLQPETRLWEKRLEIAKKYATDDPKKPWMFCEHMWNNKPKNMLCTTVEDMLMDFGIDYNDVYIGLASSTGNA